MYLRVGGLYVSTCRWEVRSVCIMEGGVYIYQRVGVRLCYIYVWMLLVFSWYQSYCLVRQLSQLSPMREMMSECDCGNSKRERIPSAAFRLFSP